MLSFLLAAALLQAPTGNGIIRGTVLNTASEGISAARVELIGGPQGTLIARTDEQGRFAFTKLPQGRYSVSVKKEQYVRQEYGQKAPGGNGAAIVIGSGAPPQNLVFHLQLATTISGSVRTEDGIPIANILVQALRRGFGVRGARQVTVFSNALTDDRGEYRLYWIDPGDYYISAAYLPQLPTAVNANEDAPRIAYAPTYYPGFTDAADARVLQVESGKNVAGIDLRLQPSPTVRVQGTVFSVVLNSAIPATVTLMAPQESGSSARYTVWTDEKGVFQMKGVNPGSYVLSAISSSGDGQIGFTTVTVGDTDFSRADIAIGPGVTLAARLFGDAPAQADFRSVKVSLQPLETFIPAPPASVIQSNGLMLLSNVQPGSYLLHVSGLPDAAYVRSAQSGPRDLLEQFVQVQYESSPPSTLDIQLAFDGGEVTGVVANAAGQVSDRATVVLIPDAARRHRPDQYRVVTSAADGRFSIAGIPPGSYKLFAWDIVEPNAWLNRDFLRGYEEFGIDATVGANEKISAQLRLVPERR